MFITTVQPIASKNKHCTNSIVYTLYTQVLKTNKLSLDMLQWIQNAKSSLSWEDLSLYKNQPGSKNKTKKSESKEKIM